MEAWCAAPDSNREDFAFEAKMSGSCISRAWCRNWASNPEAPDFKSSRYAYFPSFRQT